MRGEAMAQAVRSHLDRQTGLFQMLLDDARHAPRRNAAPPVVQENRDLTFAGDLPFLLLRHRIITQRLQSYFTDRDDPLLRALADDAQYAQLKIDVGPIEADQLAHAQTGRIEDFQRGAVTGIERRLDLDCAEQLKYVVHGEKG